MRAATNGRTALGTLVIASAFLAMVLTASACTRNQYPLTACADGRPVIERTIDVAPPNC
ncbi:MAG: hypothetical protein KDE03_11845 [Rhodobacteraceae bacterium]|nr:hypothetical protein [Paracoccaceae bacterium]